MTYDPNIPLPQGTPEFSALPIQVNFEEFFNIFSSTVGGVIYNHIALNDFNQGKHGAVIMQKQADAPAINQNLDVLVTLDAQTAAGTQPQLFVKVPKFLPTNLDTKDAANNPMRLTYNQVNTTGPQYQSFLPGGYLVYFGSTNNIANTITVTPNPSAIITALASPTGSTGGTGYNISAEVTQPDKVKLNSSNAPPGATFLYFIIARD